MTKMKHLAIAAAFSAAALASGSTFAAATIINPAGTVALGVNNFGELNTSVGSIVSNASSTGLAYKFPDGSWRDATSPGCLCEGWGVSVNNSISGSANRDDGTVGLTLGSFTSTASTATSTVSLSSLSGLTVTHAYAPATNASSNLFVANVTISNNTGADVSDVKYVRVMDWDVPPTEFSEYVTIKGTATTTLLETSHDNGFASANPLAFTSPLNGATLNTDFTDNGPADHGAYFLFNFGTIADGDSYTFQIFYGAAGSEADAIAAIGAEGIELYSLGQSNGGQITGSPATYIFGFSGVGGTPVVPTNPVPEAGSLTLLALGMVGLPWLRRRRVR